MSWFLSQLKTAPRGEWTEYHLGYLPLDRHVPEFDQVAREAWACHEAGLALLCQRKESEGTYAYYAVRTREFWVDPQVPPPLPTPGSPEAAHQPG